MFASVDPGGWLGHLALHDRAPWTILPVPVIPPGIHASPPSEPEPPSEESVPSWAPPLPPAGLHTDAASSSAAAWPADRAPRSSSPPLAFMADAGAPMGLPDDRVTDLLACGDIESNPGPEDTQGTSPPALLPLAFSTAEGGLHPHPPASFNFADVHWFPHFSVAIFPMYGGSTISSPFWTSLIRPSLSPFWALSSICAQESIMRARILHWDQALRCRLARQHAPFALMGHVFSTLLLAPPGQECLFPVGGAPRVRPQRDVSSLWDGPALPPRASRDPPMVHMHVAGLLGVLLFLQAGRGAVRIRRLISTLPPTNVEAWLFLSQALHSLLLAPRESLVRVLRFVMRRAAVFSITMRDLLRDIAQVYVDIASGRRLPPKWVWAASDVDGRPMGLYAAPSISAGTLPTGQHVVRLTQEAWCVCTVSSIAVLHIGSALRPYSLEPADWDAAAAAMAALDTLVSLSFLPETFRPDTRPSMLDAWGAQMGGVGHDTLVPFRALPRGAMV